MQNFVSNAIKFTFKGSITISIDIHNKQNLDSNENNQFLKYYKISVEDTGIGIS